MAKSSRDAQAKRRVVASRIDIPRGALGSIDPGSVAMPFAISPQIPPQVWQTGQRFALHLAMEEDSTPAPSAWAATGLPAGVSIDASGKISSAASVPGIYDIVVTATGDGPVSDSVAFQIGITDSAIGAPLLRGAVKTDFDVPTGIVTIPGTKPGEGAEILFSKRGDTIQLAVGFVESGTLMPLDLVSLVAAAKVFEPEGIVAQSDGVWYQVGDYREPRYVIDLPFVPGALNSALGEEESDAGTEIALLAEIEAAWNWWPPGTDPQDPWAEPRLIRRTSQTFKLRLSRDWIT